MRWVQPKVFLIAQTMMQAPGTEAWLQHLEAERYWQRLMHELGHAAPVQEGEVLTDAAVTSPEYAVANAARRCYLSFEAGLNPNVTKVREDDAAYLENILKQGHGSVLAHATFSLAIENVSRVFTAEMNRHQAGSAISEASMRYVRYDDIPLVETPFLRSHEGRVMRESLENAAIFIENYYKGATERNLDEAASFEHKKRVTSLLRRMLPLGIATGGVWTYNARAWRHILVLRGASAAEEEIREVMHLALPVLQQAAPHLFADIYRLPSGDMACKYPKV